MTGFWDQFDIPCPDPCTDPCCADHGCGGRRDDCACRAAGPPWNEGDEQPWLWSMRGDR